MTPNHKWATPQEWLIDVIENREINVAYLVDLLDADTIENAFESSMDADGYFDQLEGGGE